MQWRIITIFKQVMNVALKQVSAKTATAAKQQLLKRIQRLLQVPGEKEERQHIAKQEQDAGSERFSSTEMCNSMCDNGVIRDRDHEQHGYNSERRCPQRVVD